MAGLANINEILAHPVFDLDKFTYVSIYNESLGRHEAYYQSLENQTIILDGVCIQLEKEELINVEYSYKYSAAEVTACLTDAKLHHAGKWTDVNNRYDLHLFSNPPFFLSPANAPTSFPPNKEFQTPYPPFNEFQEIWAAWYIVFNPGTP